MEELVLEVRMDFGGEKCSDQSDDSVYGDARHYDGGFLCFGGSD